MFKNVFIGVDGKPGGRDAIALASGLVDSAGKLTLVHVHSGPLRASHAISPALVRAERQASIALLEQERLAADVSAEIVSLEAMSPGEGLHRQAEDQGADLLVVGSCRHGSVGRVMLGDDTRAALNGAPCAVAISPHGYAERPTQIIKVGVAYNGSRESAAALAQARDIAAATGATVHALEVVSIPSVAYTGLIAPAIGETIDAMLQEATSRMKALPDVDARAVYGLAGEELANFSDEIDLLIVGSRGYGPVKRLVLGSTSDYLQRHARCSLLVLPRSVAPAGSRGDELGAPAVAVV
ncbi:MAG: universal stress protein [Solirubrobacterales bacterium]|nr:universal stress protein [Solirubrobacterales bacterium]